MKHGKREDVTVAVDKVQMEKEDKVGIRKGSGGCGACGRSWVVSVA
jgi:hypothetical protein